MNDIKDAHKLIMEGSAAFADMEQNGMCIDTAYLDRTIETCQSKIKSMEVALREDGVYSTWRKHFGTKTNLGSHPQLGKIIFGVMGVEAKHRTKTGRPKTDIAALEDVEFPFVKKWVSTEKLKKVLSTNLMGIKRELVDGFLRPVANLHLARTHRSSVSDPNSQNFPNRDPKPAKLVRRAFIPRGKDYLLVESDFSGIEVRAAACYHHDPTMLRYIEDDYDLHTDMAAECYKLENAQVSKPIRHMGKNGFVFPSFYGDWFRSISESMWRAVDRSELTLNDGTKLRDHLTDEGITELGSLDGDPVAGTFEHHIKKVEDRFWNDRFSIYTKWKKEWWEAYLDSGWFQLKTGFICSGIYSRNEAINYPIQGTAFHWLLWTLIELNKWLKSNRMLSKIIGQIHDSILLDCHRSEVQDVLCKIEELVVEKLRENWPWIIVPLAIDVEVSETNWFEKKPWVQKGGKWGAHSS